MAATHEVTNQPPPLVGYDASEDPAMLSALHREGAGWAEDEVRRLGRLAGGEQAQENGRLANENPPRLRTHDRYGHRIDEVEFHPAWHELMRVAVTSGLHAAPWRDDRPGAHVARAAAFYVWGQTDAGHGCPISMTYSIVPALRHAPDLARRFEPLLAARDYDPGLRPPEQKSGLLSGMSMTEKQGGSDVRANTTTAIPADDGSYRITGHKWFTSAPMNDLFMVLAQVPGAGPVLLPAAPRAARRDAQRDAVDAAEGQARQPVQRLGRGRVRGRDGVARRRGGPGRPHDPRHGQLDPPGLRARRRDRDARRA